MARPPGQTRSGPTGFPSTSDCATSAPAACTRSRSALLSSSRWLRVTWAYDATRLAPGRTIFCRTRHPGTLWLALRGVLTAQTQHGTQNEGGCRTDHTHGPSITTTRYGDAEAGLGARISTGLRKVSRSRTVSVACMGRAARLHDFRTRVNIHAGVPDVCRDQLPAHERDDRRRCSGLLHNAVTVGKRYIVRWCVSTCRVGQGQAL